MVAKKLSTVARRQVWPSRRTVAGRSDNEPDRPPDDHRRSRSPFVTCSSAESESDHVRTHDRPSQPGHRGPRPAAGAPRRHRDPRPQVAELLARKQAAVSDGVGTVLPVFIKAAGGGVLVDVDDNSLIDLGAGIAVVNVGNAAPTVVDGIQEQAAAFTHTCFMVTPYEGYVAVAEQLNRLTPGDHAKKTALFNSGAEAVENAVKIAQVRHRPLRQSSSSSTPTTDAPTSRWR